MPGLLFDRVQETTTTTGTGPVTLAGAKTGYRTFGSVLAVDDTTYYVIESGAQWEVGFGTYSATNTLTRTTVIASSNANAAVSFSAGTKNVFMTAAAATQYNFGVVLGNIGLSATPSDVSGEISILGVNGIATESISGPNPALVISPQFASAVGLGVGNSEGTAPTIARSDHTHANPSLARGRTTATPSASTVLTTIQTYALNSGAVGAGGGEYEFFASLRVINTTAASNAVVTVAVGATNILVMTQAIGTTAAAAPGAPVLIWGRVSFLSPTSAVCSIHLLRSQAVAANVFLNTAAPVTIPTVANGGVSIDLKFNTSAATSTFICDHATIQRVR